MPVNDGYGHDDEEPPATPNPRHGEATYGSTTYDGPLEQVRSSAEAPWRINKVRVDGVSNMPAAVPGESASVECYLTDAPGLHSAEQRFRTLRQYLADAPWVSTMTSQGKCFYREHHDAPDGAQLVEVAPIEAGATGSEDPPARRGSISQARWAVVTGGQESFIPAGYPSPTYAIELELTTIAPSSEFADAADPRQAVRDAYERNGLGL